MNELNRKMERAEERIRELEDTTKEIIQSQQNRENQLEKMKNLRDLWDYNKGSNSCVIKVSERWEKESRYEKVLKRIIAENSPNLPRNLSLH